MFKVDLTIIGLLLFLFSFSSMADESDVAKVLASDPHRNELGFFDLHICNWPEKPPFFKAIFSTTKFEKIDKMEVFHPDGRRLGEFNPKFYREINKKKPLKRVYLMNIDVPEGSITGWYSIKVTRKDGNVFVAKDLLTMNLMSQVKDFIPVDGAEDIPVPKELRWQPVAGAKYYQVFVRDAFENTLLLSSKLTDKTSVKIQKDLFEPGGTYIWSVHARDVNENIILGDFNHGSLSHKSEFTVKD